jgi:transcriptional regulator with GAF, ATPase, and Fis domain
MRPFDEERKENVRRLGNGHGVIEPIDAKKPHKVNVRVIAATNQTIGAARYAR